MMEAIVAGRWNRHSSTRPEAQTLWKTRNRRDEGHAGEPELFEAQNSLATCLIRELEETGVAMLSDGGIRWDSVYDVTRQVNGCSGFEELVRIPDTNHFHRQPVPQLPLAARESLLLGDLLFAKERTRLPLIMCLPGPYSTALQTKNLEEIGLERLARAYAEVFRGEIAVLLEQGAALVRIEEPQILHHPEDWKLFQLLMRYLASGLDTSKVALATWFGDVTRLPGYFDLPFGTFFVDFVEGRQSAECLAGFPQDKKLVAGLFDARQSYRESAEALKRFLVQSILKHVPQERVSVSSNTDFHFLPWDEAVVKVRSMVGFARSCGDVALKTLPTRRFRAIESFRLPPCEAAFPNVIPGERPRGALSGLKFPTSAVGSYPQNAEIRAARSKLKKRELDEPSYRAMVERHTIDWMRFQDGIGLTVPVSGEFFREDMAAYFGRAFGGTLRDFVPSYENRRYRPVEYDHYLMRGSAITVKEFLFAQSLTSRPVKETLTGPATLADWALIASPAYYSDRYGFRVDFAASLRKEIGHLRDAGVKVLQIDEPALTTKMETLIMDLDAIYETVRGFDKDFYLILHICYSDTASLDKAFPHILRLPFHQLHMEMANRKYSLLELIKKHGFGGKDIGLGVVDVHTNNIETVDEIVAGVEKTLALGCFTPQQIWLTPDCGFKERSDAVAQEKLRKMAAAAEICREKFSS